MEKTRNEKIREVLLAGFVAVCVSLIFMVWLDALSDKSTESPYFYRDKPGVSESFSMTNTAIAEDMLLGTDIPTPEKMHRNETPTPLPTQAILFTPESDN